MMLFTILENKRSKTNDRQKVGLAPTSVGFWRKNAKRLLAVIGAILFWFIVWYAFALYVDKEIILPKPTAVIIRLRDLIGHVPFWIACGTTVLRIFAGTLAGIVAGIVLAVLMLFSRIARILISPLLSAVKATPVASFIIAALFWIGRGQVPAFISFLIVLPVICDSVYTGIRNTDKNLVEVTRIYRFSCFKKLRNLYIPSVIPYFLSALRTSIGMAWKSGVAAEVLCTPANSIGKELNMTKVFMETPDMFAWTISIIVLSIVFEKLTVWLVGRGLNKYGVMMEGKNAED